jgi:hypothetical protein
MTTLCLVGVLAAAFAVVAFLALSEASDRRQPAGIAAIPASATGGGNMTDRAATPPGATVRLLGTLRGLLDGEEVECERIVRLLLGIEEHAPIREEQLFRVLLGLDADAEIDRDHIAGVLGIETDETIDCDWVFRTLLGLEEGRRIDNEQVVRLLLGIDGEDDLDTEQVLTLLERAVAAGEAGN